MNVGCLLSEWVVSAVEGTGQVFSALALFVVLFVAQLVVLVPMVLQALWHRCCGLCRHCIGCRWSSAL